MAKQIVNYGPSKEVAKEMLHKSKDKPSFTKKKKKS